MDNTVLKNWVISTGKLKSLCQYLLDGTQARACGCCFNCSLCSKAAQC